jgi:MaoC like domain
VPIVLETPHALGDWVGRELTLTDWFPIAQERIEQFAEVTEDRQWIHVDRGHSKGHRNQFTHEPNKLRFSPAFRHRACQCFAAHMGNYMV